MSCCCHSRAPGFRRAWHELRRHYGVTAANAKGLARYWRCRQAHRTQWAPTVVAAALRFLCHERGIARVFFHDHATKCRLQGLERFSPPRSLYTDLPRRLGFTRTADRPAFLARELASMPAARFWVMHPAQPEARAAARCGG